MPENMALHGIFVNTPSFHLPSSRLRGLRPHPHPRAVGLLAAALHRLRSLPLLSKRESAFAFRAGGHRSRHFPDKGSAGSTLKAGDPGADEGLGGWVVMRGAFI